MAPLADSLDLGRLRLSPGEGRRMDLEVDVDPFEYGGQHYAVEPSRVPVRLDISRTTGSGHALRMRFEAQLDGPCMRCLGEARPIVAVDSREVDQPGAGDELSSPYVAADQELDLRGWAREALALAQPAQVLCSEDCLGLCPVCGEDLNSAPADHSHEAPPDPRWAKLDELKLE